MAARRTFAYLLFAVSLAAFIGALQVTYAAFMTPRFGYLGYSYHDPAWGWMLGTYLLLLVVAAFLPYTTKRVSGFAVWFLYVSLLVPVATVPLYGSTRDPGGTFLFSLFCATVWVLLALTLRRVETPIVPVRKSGAGFFWAAIVTISVVTYALIHVVFGIQINIVSVFDVYGLRLSYRDEVIPSVPLLGYLITNQGNVINPLLMAIGVVRKRWSFVVVGVLGQLVLYSTTGYKTVLISIPLCIAIAFIMRNRQSLRGIIVVLGATALVWACIAIDRIASLGLVDIIVSRIFLTAGYLMPHYLNAYEGNPPAMWAYSFLSPLVESPYAMTPGFHVATVALGRPEVQLNASLFADGYANLGLWGIAIEAIALVVILIMADSAGRGIPLAILLPTSLLPVFALANGSPFTGFLSYGFALMILLFALYTREDAPPSSRKRRLWNWGRRTKAMPLPARLAPTQI